MILNLSKSKKLSFYRRTDIYIGERDFDEIKVLLPSEVDGNEISDLLLKLHLVNNKGEYTHIALSKKIDGEVMVGSTMIVADLTNIAQDFFIYIEMIKGDNEVIGKTNVLKITINPLPDEKDRIIPKEEYEETIDELTEIIERNTEAMNRINGFEDGKSAYEIAVKHGYEGTEEEWLQSLNGKDGKSAYEIAVEQGYEGTEEEWLSEIKDYSKLNNKPSINGVKLSGDKTPDELGLQKKLTIQEPSGYDPKDYLFLRNNGTLGFNSQFVLSIQDSGFPKLSYWGSVNGVASITTSSIVSDGLTVGINGNIPVSEGGTYYRFCTNGETREEIYLTNIGKAYQKLTTLPGGTWVEGQWQEIGGGSEIVSGVVNQNGTITFTDTDGNTFTTSGSSVIGDDGFSPTATVTQTASGATVSITDKNGTTTANISNGADGQDYVLTSQDKTDIANIVLGELPTTQGVQYGNANN